MTATDGLYVETSADLIEKVAWDTGYVIERDPETDRIYLRTDNCWYTAQLGGAA